MDPDQFDHVLRAAAAVLGASELIVIGSQAVHATLRSDLPVAAARSVEVDVVPLDDADGSKADLVDGVIGEASMFHDSFGIYAQGVAETTAVLPDGWRDRLVRYESAAVPGVVAWCLELGDLWISKAIAGRVKDGEFCRAVLELGAVDAEEMAGRLRGMPELDSGVRTRVLGWLAIG